jgi:hypothetical protein
LEIPGGAFLFTLKKTSNSTGPTSKVFASKQSAFNGESVGCSRCRWLRPLVAATNVENN